MSINLKDWQILRNSRLFAQLNDETFQDVVGMPKSKRFAKGGHLFHIGEPARDFFLILEGWVLLYRDQPNGEKAVVQIFGPHETFAEGLLAPNSVYPVSAQIVSDVRILCFDIADYRTKIATNPQLALSLVSTCYYQMHQLVGQIERMKHWSARRRIAEFLIWLTEQRSGEALIELPLENKLIAARLGMTPSTFSRTLTKLRFLGVSVHGRKIRVSRIEKLAQFARGEQVRENNANKKSSTLKF